MTTKLIAFLVLTSLGVLFCVAGVRGVSKQSISVEVGSGRNTNRPPEYILEYRGSDAVFLGSAEVAAGAVMVFSGLIFGLSIFRGPKALFLVKRNVIAKMYFWSFVLFALLLFPPHKIFSGYNFIFYVMFVLYHVSSIVFEDFMDRKRGAVIQGMIALAIFGFIFLIEPLAPTWAHFF